MTFVNLLGIATCIETTLGSKGESFSPLLGARVTCGLTTGILLFCSSVEASRVEQGLIQTRSIPSLVSRKVVVNVSFKDGTCFCLCASRGIFLRSLKLCRESRTLQVLLVSKTKIGGKPCIFQRNKAPI